MSTSTLLTRFPWAKSPLIINAPMAGAATPRLASEVSKAGGLGFIGCVANISPSSPDLAQLSASLASARADFPSLPPSSPIPVGAGFITSHASSASFASTALPVLAEHRPAAVWLFAPDGHVKPHAAAVRAIKTLNPPPVVFVQVGNVAAAREAVEDGADVVVAQGVDAGGHQFRRGSGVVALVPEVKDFLAGVAREVALVAAGGIVDGRGVAAALALGAEGVVLGTRFVVATESAYPEFRKEVIVKAVDGGVSTLKSPFNDQINKSALWGPLYDGRAIIGPIHEDFLAGASLEECLAKLEKEYTEDEAIKMTRTWAGAGVGLVNKAQPAAEIVEELREGAKATVKALSGLV